MWTEMVSLFIKMMTKIYISGCDLSYKFTSFASCLKYIWSFDHMKWYHFSNNHFHFFDIVIVKWYLLSNQNIFFFFKQKEDNIRCLNMLGHFGFDCLAHQLVDKFVQQGFFFNILCVGKCQTPPMNYFLIVHFNLF